jgi:hypothetical protein
MQQVMANGTILYPASNDVWKARMEEHETDLDITKEYVQGSLQGVARLKEELEAVKADLSNEASVGESEQTMRMEILNDVSAFRKELHRSLCTALIIGWSCVAVPLVSMML